MENLEGKSVSEILKIVDDQRKAILGERYKTKQTIAKAVTVESLDQFGRANITVDGEQRVVAIHSASPKGLASYDLVLQITEKPFNYKDNADNIVTVPANTMRYVLVAPTA